MSTSKQQLETQAYTRNKLISTLLQIKHPEKAKQGEKRDNVTKLELYAEQGLAAAKADPDLFGHLIAWDAVKGKVRDTKVAFPVLALRGTTSDDVDLAENAVAHMLLLSPRELLRCWDFHLNLTRKGMPATAGFRRLLRRGTDAYLKVREQNFGWWTAVVLQHRDTVRLLYKLAHRKPVEYARQILFEREFAPHTVFAKVANLHSMSPQEVAGTVMEYKIPYGVAVGALSGGANKAKDHAIVLALIATMSGNELLNNSKMLIKYGVLKDDVLKAAYEQALVRAREDKKVETLKAGRAAEAVKGTSLESKLDNLQVSKTAQLGSIEGDWAIFGDCSGSMKVAIELARKVAGLITERVRGAVYLVFFDTSPNFVEVTGLSYAQIVEKTRRINAGGGTSIGCAVDYLRSRNIVVNGIVIASDGGERQSPMFAEAYQKYCKQLEVEPTVYLLHVNGSDPDWLSGNCERAGIQLEKRELGEGTDYYALPNIISTLHANRYALFDQIMETPLLTIQQAVERRA